jgi:hypothetical protein
MKTFVNPLTGQIQFQKSASLPSYDIQTKDEDYQILVSDEMVRAQVLTADRVYTLPQATGSKRTIVVKKIPLNNKITVNTLAGDTVDGVSFKELTEANEARIFKDIAINKWEIIS